MPFITLSPVDKVQGKVVRPSGGIIKIDGAGFEAVAWIKGEEYSQFALLVAVSGRFQRARVVGGSWIAVVPSQTQIHAASFRHIHAVVVVAVETEKNISILAVFPAPVPSGGGVFRYYRRFI